MPSLVCRLWLQWHVVSLSLPLCFLSRSIVHVQQISLISYKLEVATSSCILLRPGFILENILLSSCRNAIGIFFSRRCHLIGYCWLATEQPDNNLYSSATSSVMTIANAAVFKAMSMKFCMFSYSLTVRVPL